MSTVPYANYEVKKNLKPKGLVGLSEKLIDQHWSLYEGYVNNVNLLDKMVWECLQEGRLLQAPPFSECGRRIGFENNRMIHHEYNFGTLTALIQEPANYHKLDRPSAHQLVSCKN